MDEKLLKEKNKAYWERNQLVAALSKLFPSFLQKHDEKDKEWDPEWRTIVYVYIPCKEGELIEHTHVRLDDGKWYYQLSWHIHDTEISMFDHLRYDFGRQWDGHSTEEKYRRLRKYL